MDKGFTKSTDREMFALSHEKDAQFYAEKAKRARTPKGAATQTEYAEKAMRLAKMLRAGCTREEWTRACSH
jgi:hypothetical protein